MGIWGARRGRVGGREGRGGELQDRIKEGNKGGGKIWNEEGQEEEGRRREGKEGKGVGNGEGERMEGKGKGKRRGEEGEGREEREAEGEGKGRKGREGKGRKEKKTNQSRRKDGIKKREVASEGLDEIRRIRERGRIEVIITRFNKNRTRRGSKKILREGRKLRISKAILRGGGFPRGRGRSVTRHEIRVRRGRSVDASEYFDQNLASLVESRGVMERKRVGKRIWYVIGWELEYDFK